MTATFESTEDYTLLVSDEARLLYESERDIHHDQQRAEILTFSSAGAIVCIAALMIKHLLGS